MRYPVIQNYITRIDTILKTVTITKFPMFYEDGWFWSTICALFLLIISIM
jgi:hypothetical protein